MGWDDGHHLQEVSIAISNRLQLSVGEVTAVEHIMALRLRHAFSFVSLIAAYSPTYVYKLDEKESFYARLTSVAKKCPQQYIYIVMGEFNAVSSCGRASY